MGSVPQTSGRKTATKADKAAANSSMDRLIRGGTARHREREAELAVKLGVPGAKAPSGNPDDTPEFAQIRAYWQTHAPAKGIRNADEALERLTSLGGHLGVTSTGEVCGFDRAVSAVKSNWPELISGTGTGGGNP